VDKEIMLNFICRYFWVFSTIATFAAGWYSGYTYYNVKQLKVDLNVSNQQIKTQNITNRDAENVAIKKQRDTIESKLNEQKRINVLDKEYINKHNVITHDLLRRVGALRAKNNKLSKNATPTIGTISTNEIVSPYEYVQWAAGLKTHDDVCVMRFNGLLELYNKQMIIINGFNND
jgi:hypothetical protein